MKLMNTLDMKTFKELEEKGRSYVVTFCKYLEKRKIPYRLATMEEQKLGIDVVTETYKYEIKKQFSEADIAIEESSTGGMGTGWIYSSQADWLIEVYNNRLIRISMPDLRELYLKTKYSHKLLNNSDSYGIYGQTWTSQFRVYNLCEISPYIDDGKPSKEKYAEGYV